jgi:hypothetical protein
VGGVGGGAAAAAGCGCGGGGGREASVEIASTTGVGGGWPAMCARWRSLPVRGLRGGLRSPASAARGRLSRLTARTAERAALWGLVSVIDWERRRPHLVVGAILALRGASFALCGPPSCSLTFRRPPSSAALAVSCDDVAAVVSDVSGALARIVLDAGPHPLMGEGHTARWCAREGGGGRGEGVVSSEWMSNERNEVNQRWLISC